MKLSSRPFYVFVFLVGMVFLFCACRRQSYPNKPFVYENKVVVADSNGIDKDERKRLETALQNYWDDSLLTRKVQQFGFFYRLKNPPVFDTSNIPRTKALMNGYLKSQGYYYPELTSHYDTTYKADQQRVHVTMDINAGKATIIDSLAYGFNDSALQFYAMRGFKEALIKKNITPVAKEAIAAELDRLVDTFRVRGYYKMTRDYVVAEVDTMDIALLQQVTDPFQLAEAINETIEKRKRNPTADVVIKERRNADSSLIDSSAMRRYYVGNIFYYPETGPFDIYDSLIGKADYRSIVSPDTSSITMFYTEGKFSYKPLREHTYMRRGGPYNERTFIKTMNNLSSIGAWRQVDSRTSLRGDTVDFHIFLIPYPKHNLTFDLEASRNTGDVFSSNSLIGLALGATYRNRNVWKRAIQSATSFRNGVELNLTGGSSLLQTFQSSIGHNYSFPQLIPKGIQRFFSNTFSQRSQRTDAVKTIVGVNAAYSERSNYFRLRSLTASYGWEWTYRRNRAWQWKFLNLEFYSLDTLAALSQAIQSNPFLQNVFNTGNIISTIVSRTQTWTGNANNVNYVRLSAEWSHGLGLSRNYQFIKFEGEARKNISFRKTSLAFRVFGGIGYNYGNNPKFGTTLPFFKQFIGGGPNSMRAWTLRQLGLGSNIANDTIAYKDRYGDMQLEANIEYRFPLATIGGVNIGSALFADMGNVWNVKGNPDLPGSEFKFSRLGKDLAIGIGTGLRFDFTYFMIRVDGGIKLKDPARLTNNGWLDFTDFTWRNNEKTYIDPTTKTPVNRNNYAIQLGINLPF
ncbi:hypothetical protein [Foetidibacter luteolus]|uniref:hypothetical protein n=1 Tax=Foetidibacter luteolus TaxID=2608880 RepID=UPI00129C0418|nr:hypothetical protein [Foetidibacter luteolus]